MADDRAERHPMVRRWWQVESPAVDWLVAAGLTALFVLLLSAPRAAGTPLVARLVLAAAMGLPVGARRRWPVPVFTVVTVASLVAALSGILSEPLLSVAYALYWVAVTVRPIRWVPTSTIGVASVVFLLGVVLAGTRNSGELPLQVVGFPLAGMVWTGGRAVRERRLYAERSAQRRTADAVAAERLRIARELHDIVAHHIGVIAVKAGVANHVLAKRPEEAGAALGVIETASRIALAELRHMLGVLRSHGGTGEEEPQLRPPPGLSGLPALIEHTATAGVEVELHTRNTGGLPEAVDLSAYRIVQEALTNVIKHVGPTRCRVGLVADERELRIEVTDSGPGGRAARRPGHSDGHGLLGMRERVALHGGEFRAGPRPHGGFGIAARLPFTRQSD